LIILDRSKGAFAFVFVLGSWRVEKSIAVEIWCNLLLGRKAGEDWKLVSEKGAFLAGCVAPIVPL